MGFNYRGLKMSEVAKIFGVGSSAVSIGIRRLVERAWEEMRLKKILKSLSN